MDEPLLPWREVFDLAPVAMSVVGVDGRQVAGNPAYARLLGYPVADKDRIDVVRITRAEDQEWTRAYLDRLISGELEEFRTDKVYVRADGSEILARLTAWALRAASGECTALVAVLEPVESRPTIGDVIVRRLLEHSDDTLTIVDESGRVKETTGRYKVIMGYPPEFWATRSVFDVLAPDEIPAVLAFREAVLAAPRNELNVETTVIAADGTPQLLVVRAVNLLDDPDVGGIVMTSRNVTEERALLAELARRTAAAETEAAARANLLATVSHELRNPLHALQGLAELLASSDLPAAAAQHASALRRQLTALSRVTQDLLDAATLDSGRVTIRPAPTDVRMLIEEVSELGRASAPAQSGVVVSAEVGPEVPTWLMLDGERLRQVLANLLGNAIKFTPAGTVRLVVSALHGGSLRCSVSDTGVGIPPDERDAVLLPFRTGSTAGAAGGTGLGLSIVRRLTEAMGGTLELASELGKGSTFTIDLAVGVADAPTGPGREIPTAPRGLRVLVVEDNPVNQGLAISQLERLGMVPEVVGTGEDAVALVTQRGSDAFDIVLMDHQLPGMDGVQTTRRLRELLGASMPPVVGLSASASMSQREAFLAAGMDDFVAKPATLADLSAAFARVTSAASDARLGGAPVPVSAPAPATGRDGSAGAPVAVDVDETVLVALVDELADRALVHSLVNTFLAELDARVTALVDGLESADEVRTRRAAHTLKSSARMLGARRLSICCEEAERSGVLDDVAEVAAAADLARSGLRAWIATG